MLRPALAALLALAVAVPGAAAFSSGPDGPHDDITRDGAAVAGFPEGGVDALVAAVRAPDRAAGKEPFHHCDRVPPASDGASFNATVAYVRQQGDEARNASLQGDAGGAIEALGRALHALQDCFAHSNAVDLPDPRAVVHAVVGQAPPPPGLRLTAKDQDDPYFHDDHAKDRPDGNAESRARMADNRTKFEAARDLATDATALFLELWLAGRNPAELGPLGEVDAPGGLVPRWAPAVPAPAALAAAGLAAWASRRR
jgi:hypothetical protein